MGHENRGRLAVNPDGNWRLCTATLPDGCTVLGTVTRADDHETGALVRFEKTGLYAQVVAGAIRPLDGRKVAAALGTTGRPKRMDGGRKVQVYLDAPSLETAARLGDGIVSEGIRRALAKL